MALFADTGYYIALLVRSDRLYDRAVQLTQAVSEPLVTTEWILAELAGALSKSPWRTLAIEFVQSLYATDSLIVIESGPLLFSQGFQRYKDRPDKSWSLVDCISFICMEEQGLEQALSADRHFEQAGFTALLR